MLLKAIKSKGFAFFSYIFQFLTYNVQTEKVWIDKFLIIQNIETLSFKNKSIFSFNNEIKKTNF